jgi:hypothetical protein
MERLLFDDRMVGAVTLMSWLTRWTGPAQSVDETSGSRVL